MYDVVKKHLSLQFCCKETSWYYITTFRIHDTCILDLNDYIPVTKHLVTLSTYRHYINKFIYLSTKNSKNRLKKEMHRLNQWPGQFKLTGNWQRSFSFEWNVKHHRRNAGWNDGNGMKQLVIHTLATLSVPRVFARWSFSRCVFLAIASATSHRRSTGTFCHTTESSK